MSTQRKSRAISWVVAISFIFVVAPGGTNISNGQSPKPDPAVRFDDHQNMMDQLGIKSLRRGADPKNQKIYDEATANPYKDSMPDVLTMKNGTKVTTAEQWPARRAEIQEDFEREVYGRIPNDVPESYLGSDGHHTRARSGGIPTVTKTLVGHVDNSAYTKFTVNIQASFTVPAKATAPCADHD